MSDTRIPDYHGNAGSVLGSLNSILSQGEVMGFSHTATAPHGPLPARSDGLSGQAEDGSFVGDLSNTLAARSLIFAPKPRPVGGWQKRALDLVVASTAIVLAIPIMMLIGLLIKATGGPIFFTHRRVGFNGKSFDCYKFCTMAKNSEQRLREYLANNPEAAEEWRASQKLKNDPRVTPLGQMLRKSSLDELPQLFNVLRGDMSCVGPRPIVSEELQKYGTLAAEYLQTRPGMTGLWQISGRNSLDYGSRVSLDTHYVRNWSIRSDLAILAWTTVVVLRFNETC